MCSSDLTDGAVEATLVTAKVSEPFFDSANSVGIGRWTNGVYAVTQKVGSVFETAIVNASANQGLHYAIGAPASAAVRARARG